MCVFENVSLIHGYMDILYIHYLDKYKNWQNSWHMLSYTNKNGSFMGQNASKVLREGKWFEPMPQFSNENAASSKIRKGSALPRNCFWRLRAIPRFVQIRKSKCDFLDPAHTRLHNCFPLIKIGMLV